VKVNGYWILLAGAIGFWIGAGSLEIINRAMDLYR
jgi:hypothetical protein